MWLTLLRDAVHYVIWFTLLRDTLTLLRDTVIT